MPESFLNDQSVPARWRILAIVNGFLINEGKCWASNAWFMEKLKCSRPTVSAGIKDLEELGLVVCKRTKRSRIIERKVGLPLRRKLAIFSEESSFTTNSVSNSEKEERTRKSASAPLQVKKSPRGMEYESIDEDGRPMPTRQKGPKPEGKNKIALRLHHAFVKLCQKHLDTSPVMDIKGYKMCLYAMNTGGLTEKQVIDLFEEWFTLGHPDEESVSITRALSARQIEGYKVRNSVK